MNLLVNPESSRETESESAMSQKSAIDHPPLTEDQLVSQTDPLPQFQAWLQEFGKFTQGPTRMCLSTSASDGKPSSRMVVLFGLDEKGLKIFNFTTSGSRKMKEIAENPFVAALLYSSELNRQIRVEGKVQQLPVEETERCFRSLPVANQLTLQIGRQDEVTVSSRQELVEMRKAVESMYQDLDTPLPLPPHAIGYLLVPDMFEFSQGHNDWLGDRLVYTKEEDGRWSLKRLLP